MTSRMRALYAAAALASGIASLLAVSSCNNADRSAVRPENAELRDVPPARAAAKTSGALPPSELTPIGTMNQSLGLTTALSEANGRGRQTRGADDFLVTGHDGDGVPQIDLNRALTFSDGSGGSPVPLVQAPASGTLATADYNTDGSITQNDIDDYLSRLNSVGSPAPNGSAVWRMPWSQGAPPSTPPVAPVPPDQPTPPAMEVSLLPGQELLVIERTRRADRHACPPRDDYPGSGTLMTRWRDRDDQPEREVPVPLEHTNVQANITGPISSVNVVQKFHNPYSSKIEAVYVFPLPDDAAVNDFVMTIGSRSVRGVIREREQAQQIYNQAKSQGYHAALMSQERSNIFTQRVANIEPNERIDISITYFNTLAFREGGYEFVFPMVVGPRYNPASTLGSGVPPRSAWGREGGEDATRGVAVPNAGTGVGAVPAFSPPSGQNVDVSYLRPGMRCGRDISIAVNLNAGVRLESIDSPTHHIGVQTSSGASTATINLNAADTIPNRDFVLRYRVAGGQVRAGMIAAHDDRSANPDDNFFTMVLVPPSDLSYCTRGPVEMVFVIDCSGSMDGQPIELAKRCVRNALPALRSGDTLQLIRFSDKADFLTSGPVNACPENIQQADRWVANLQANGGTELLNGLKPALELRGDWKRTRFVCVLSDGLLGNEPEVLGQLKRELGDSRIFTVSIGSAPNRALMNAMARMGRGCAASVSVPQDADEVMSLFMARVSSAAMSDLRLDFGSLDDKDVYPKKLPDLFVDRPVTITGRFRGQPRPGQTVRVSGRIGENRQTIDVPVIWADPAQSRAMPLVWARTRITDLDEETSWGRKAGAGSAQGPNQGEIKDLALRYGLMSAYTSFIAVDCAERTSGSYGTTVAVPAPMPPGTRYENTVPSR